VSGEELRNQPSWRRISSTIPGNICRTQQPPTAEAVGGRLTIGEMQVAGGHHLGEAGGRFVPLTLSGR